MINCFKYITACSLIMLLNVFSIAEETGKGAGLENREIKVEGAILKAVDSTIVSAQSSGVIGEIVAKEGSVLKAGDVLATIKDNAIRLKLDQQKTQMMIAKRKQENTIDKQVAVKSREVADTEYERALAANVRVANTYPRNEIDRLRLVAERCKLEVDRAEFELQMAALDAAVAENEYQQTAELLQRHTIRAPISGTVVNVEKHLGEWVEPGIEVFRIVQTDTLRVEGFIPLASDRGNLVGASAAIQLLNVKSQGEHVGTVAFVSPEVNPVNSLVRVFITVPNSNLALRPGPSVSAVIQLPNDSRKETPYE